MCEVSRVVARSAWSWVVSLVYVLTLVYEVSVCLTCSSYMEVSYVRGFSTRDRKANCAAWATIDMAKTL
jgi:hypothetical protein